MNVDDAAKAIKDEVDSGRAKPDKVIAAFDGDAPFVSDTPTDFGPDLLKSVHGADCGPKDTIEIKVDFADPKLTDKTYTVKFDRTNLMSYFKHCATADRFSVEQYTRARASLEHGNRQHLLTGRQTWVPPAPAVVSWGPGRLDVLAVGGDANLYHKHWTEERSAKEGWSCLGGYVTSAHAVSWGKGRIDIVARGVKGNVLYKSFEEGKGWSPSQTGWKNLDGEVASDPVIVSWGPNRLDIFARGMDGELLHKSWDIKTGWLPGVETWTTDIQLTAY